jgi:hypothetical protein
MPFATARSRALVLLLVFSLAACASARKPPLIDDVEQRTFHWFWDLTDTRTGLVPDRAPTPSFSSIAAVGFGLTAIPIGIERHWISREDGAQRVLTALKFFRDSEQSESPTATGYRGFYYHFLDMQTGKRFKDVELSTIDTSLLIAGALFCQMYFDHDNAAENDIRAVADQLYRRIEWDWAVARTPLESMGWTPEKGMHGWDWRGYNEAMIVYILGLGSPTHPLPDGAFQAYASTYRWADFYGQHYVAFAPLFGHQYTQVWIDFRNIRDSLGIDYFDNSRKATIAQRAYAMDHGYAENVWGLTACDGPGDFGTVHGYWARGATEGDIRDDGTIAPTAAISSMPFTPEISIAALKKFRSMPGLYGEHGFVDAFNVPLNWIDKDSLGIDQGPIVAMIENYRSGFVWRVMMRNPYVVQGLKRAGFHQ